MKIETALQGSPTFQGSIKRDHSGKELVCDVLMYRWSWLAGKKKVSQSEVTFFSEEDCRMDAALNKPEKEKLNLVVETVWGPPPLKHVAMHVIFMFFFKKMYDKLIKENCYGCQNDLGSQSDHMGSGGCLTEVDKDETEKRCFNVKSKIPFEDLVCMFTNSRREMGASTSFAELYAENVMYYMKPEGIMYFMQNENPEHRPLLKLLERC